MSGLITRSVALFAGAPQVDFQVPMPETLEEMVEEGMVASLAHGRKLAVDQWVVKAQGRYRRSAPKSLVEAVKQAYQAWLLEDESREKGDEMPLEVLDDEIVSRMQQWAETNASQYIYGGAISAEFRLEDLDTSELEDDEASALIEDLRENKPHLFED